VPFGNNFGGIKAGSAKSFMKKRSGTYGKKRETLPLEGGGKRVGVKGLTAIARGLVTDLPMGRQQRTSPQLAKKL
jgi:hypothetical protein